MIYLKTILLGIVEGLTEFIPVSSTGHLILVGDLLAFDTHLVDTFNIAIQLGAILAVVVLYRQFFIDLVKDVLAFNDVGKKKMVIMIAAILPVMIVGLLFYDMIKALFEPKVVALMLGLGGIIMIAAEKRYKQQATTFNVEDITVAQAAAVGIAQCFAVIPGTSRSGSTIVGGFIAKLDQKTSATFSFLISVPVMIMAVGYDLLKTSAQLSSHDYLLIGIGFVVSFFVALFAMVSFLKLLNRFGLVPFGIYRIVLSGVLLFVL